MTLNKQALKPGKYAILFRDNWDGERDVYETLATLGDDLIWYHHENGKSLIEYEGDEVLKVWPLDDGGNVLALLHELETKEEQRANWVQMAQDLGEKLDAAEKRIADLEAEKETLRPVGVMSEGAFRRLECGESRFIALWPRPGIYLPRKRPDDGVIVYARTSAAGIKIKGE